MLEHLLHLQKDKNWSGENNNLSQIKVNDFVFWKETTEDEAFLCRMTQAYSLRLPFTNVIIAATFAIGMISISILSLITTYTYVFHTSRYNTQYYFLRNCDLYWQQFSHQNLFLHFAKNKIIIFQSLNTDNG